MIGTTIFGGLDKKSAMEYIDSLNRHLADLKRANYNKKNGLTYNIPIRDNVDYPKKTKFFGYDKGDFEKTVSKLEIQISLAKSQLEMNE